MVGIDRDATGEVRVSRRSREEASICVFFVGYVVIYLVFSSSLLDDEVALANLYCTYISVVVSLVPGTLADCCMALVERG